MKALRRCPNCLTPVEMLRLLGNYDDSVAFEGPHYLQPEDMPDDLYVHSILPYTAEKAAPTTMHERRDGRRGPYILPHAPRCEGLARRSS